VSVSGRRTAESAKALRRSLRIPVIVIAQSGMVII
jgi:hypothetical protein